MNRAGEHLAQLLSDEDVVFMTNHSDEGGAWAVPLAGR